MFKLSEMGVMQRSTWVPTIELTPSTQTTGQTLVSIASGSTLFFGGTLFGLGLNYLYTIVLARLLGASQFGLYALGLGVFSLLSVIAIGGLDSALLRFIPTSHGTGDAPRINRLVRATFVLATFVRSILVGRHVVHFRSCRSEYISQP